MRVSGTVNYIDLEDGEYTIRLGKDVIIYAGCDLFGRGIIKPKPPEVGDDIEVEVNRFDRVTKVHSIS